MATRFPSSPKAIPPVNRSPEALLILERAAPAGIGHEGKGSAASTARTSRRHKFSLRDGGTAHTGHLRANRPCVCSGRSLTAPRTHLSPTASAYWSVSMTDLRRHSRTLYDGLARAPARSYLLNIGFTHEDLQKPIVGVNHAWIGTMPCNFNHRQLAAWACEGVREAGGTPMEVNTISISDGVTMGTEGMKASLVSRELIADSVELVGRGHYFDALLCITGCDKTVPAMAMAMARLDRPAVLVYSGSILAGSHRGRQVAVGDLFEAVDAVTAGRMSEADLRELETSACPGPGACGGQYTANTMSMVMEVIGLSPVGYNSIPAVDPAKETATRSLGPLVMAALEADRRPAEILTRRAFENAAAAVAASGGSTNAVLHLVALAREV